MRKSEEQMQALLMECSVEPDMRLKNEAGSGSGGYAFMRAAEGRGYHAIPSWGRDGYDAGAWSLVIFFERVTDYAHLVLSYVEGDLSEYAASDAAEAEAILDFLIYSHWKSSGEPWVDNITWERLPEPLRGQYSVERLRAEGRL
ncbi:hypothetical protein GXB85_05360 [Cellulomonas sp. APG4]|uniref:hypothetical protein n=1 Tax=Cellulomonas sp. APG4 TaxID=1538656 RepID=UPI001379D679|nr:hypothetical protein [Cellulomonas sp. APG4]NCT90379.1 hypothetical protein [Cellulomonas sp. APG4]